MSISFQNRTLFPDEESVRIKRVLNPRTSRQAAGGSVVRPRDGAEPTVRWPEATWEQPAAHPFPHALKPHKFPGVGSQPHYDERQNNHESYDMVPDPDHETIV